MNHEDFEPVEPVYSPFDEHGVYVGYIPPEEEVTPLTGEEAARHARFKGVLAGVRALELVRNIDGAELPSDHGRENHTISVPEGGVSPITRSTESLTSKQKNANARREEIKHHNRFSRHYRQRGQSS